jgi:ATP-dependent exoDNAse (exonuclease V) beta subunit
MNFEIIEKLNGFSHVLFEEKRHIYTIGEQKLTSVTTFLKQFEEEKDWYGIAERYAAKNGETAEYWQDAWKQEGSLAGTKGDEFHKYAEFSMANKIYDINVVRVAEEEAKCDKIDWFDPWKSIKKLKMMWDVFWLQAQGKLIPVRSEFITGDAELGIGGMVDQLFWNVKEQELQIWDWKTSKKVAKSNDFNKLTGVLSHLDECEWNKYSLQIAIYKYIIEKNLGLKIGKCYIGWFNENNDTYKIIKARNLDKEVKQIFE